MLNQPEPACLVIADISGYTGFLAGAEAAAPAEPDVPEAHGREPIVRARETRRPGSIG